MTLPPDLQAKYGRDAYWRDWIRRIPSISFPRGWKIQIIPPFGGALCRFIVNDRVSVYLDGDNSLGYFCDDDNNPKPYWEIHPYDDDVMRYDMDDIEGLLAGIKKSLRQTKEQA